MGFEKKKRRLQYTHESKGKIGIVGDDGHCFGKHAGFKDKNENSPFIDYLDIIAEILEGKVVNIKVIITLEE